MNQTRTPLLQKDLPPPFKAAGGAPAPEPSKILLIKLAAVGDLVIASTFFDKLRRRFPHADIQLLVGRSCQRVVENNPVINRLLVADDGAIYKGNVASQCREFFRLVSRLRRERFDMVFVMHRAWAFKLLALFANIPVRVGLAKRRLFNPLTHTVVPASFRNEREVYLDLLRKINCPVEYDRSHFSLTPAEDEFCADFIRQHAIAEDEVLIAIAPGGGDNVKSSMPSRRWPQDRFAQLIQEIQRQRPCRVVLVGGPQDREAVSAIREECPESIDATHLTFGEMASIFRRCQVYVGNDSGPLHIASAMGLFTLALFGPTDPKQWASPDATSTVLFKNVECSPCYHHGEFPDCEHLSCMRAIDVTDAVDAVLHTLKKALESAPVAQP